MSIHEVEWPAVELEATIAELDNMAEPTSPGTDKIMNAFALSQGNILRNKQFPEVFPYILQGHDHPERRAHKLLRGVQMLLSTYEPPEDLPLTHRRESINKPPAIAYEYDYPNSQFEEVKMWDEVLPKIYSDPDLSTRFMIANRLYDIQTNRSQRGVGAKLPMVMHKGRFDRPINALEFGASQNQIWKQLALNERYPYAPVTAGLFAGPLRTFFEDSDATSKLDAVLKAKLEFGQLWGGDINPLTHTEHLLWARACWRPSDLANPALMENFDALTAESPEGVHFVVSDFSLEYPHCFEEVPSRITEDGEVKATKFDFVFIPTMQHQLQVDEQITSLKNAERCAHEDSLIVLQDFFPPDYNSTYPVFPRNIYDRNAIYMTAVKDMREPEKGYIPIAEWGNGSCERVELYIGREALECAVATPLITKRVIY
jgi:hypothetical protein